MGPVSRDRPGKVDRAPTLEPASGTALYVHFPYCQAKCTYCDFYSVAAEGQDLPGTLDALLAEASRRADDAVSLHEFTHRLNRELPQSEKLGIVEMLWRVSHADGHIDKHEEQLIQRIAGLLHISDRDRVRLKLKVVVGAGEGNK